MTQSCLGITIFCDDVREEKRSKLSFIGIYASSLIIEEANLETTRPIYAVSILRDLIVGHSYSLIMKLGDEEFKHIKLPVIPETLPKQVSVITELHTHEIQKTGNLEVFLKCSDDEEFKIGSLSIETNSKPVSD